MRSIEIYTHPQRLPHTDRPTVSSALEAKFRVQYCVVRALMHGKVLLDHFEGDAWANPQAQALLKVMQTGPHPTMTDKPPAPCAQQLPRGRRHVARQLSHQPKTIVPVT